MSSTNWISCSAPLVHFSTKCVNRLLDSCRCSFYRTGITTSAPVSCCPTAALLLLEGRPALWPSGISHPRRPASKPNWPPRRRPATHSPSAPTLRCVSPAAVTGTSPSGTFTTKPSSGGQERHLGLYNCELHFINTHCTWRDSQAVPGPHRRCQLHRHLSRRHQAVDRRSWQHSSFLGPPRGTATPTARLHISGWEIIFWLLGSTMW